TVLSCRIGIRSLGPARGVNSFGWRRRCSPILRRKIGDVLRKHPPVPGRILDSVLPFSEWPVRWLLQNSGPTLLRVIEVPTHIIDRDVHVSVDLVTARCSIRSALSTKHDGPFRDRELRVTNHAVALEAESLREAECSTKPIDRLTDILIDQDRNNSRSRR